MSGTGTLFDARDFPSPNHGEQILLDEIGRLNKALFDAQESALFYLAEFKRVYGDYLDLKEPDRAR